MNNSIALFTGITLLVASSVYEYPMPVQYNGIIELGIARVQFQELNPNPNPDPDPDPDPDPEICSTCDNTGYIYIEADGQRRKIQCNNDNCPYWKNRVVPVVPVVPTVPVVPVTPEPTTTTVDIDVKDFNHVIINGKRVQRLPPPLSNRNFVSAKWVSYDIWQECYGDRCQRFKIKIDDKKTNLGLNPEQYNNDFK